MHVQNLFGILSQSEYGPESEYAVHVNGVNVHETSASLISRRVTWGQEPGSHGGSPVPDKALGAGGHCGPCSPFAWRHLKWVFAYSENQDPPEGNAAHSLQSTHLGGTHTVNSLQGTYLIRHDICINNRRNSWDYMYVYIVSAYTDTDEILHPRIQCTIN